MVKRLLRYPKGSDPYVAGVERFIEFAYKDKPEGSKIYCPCQSCVHTTVQSKDEMYGHLVCNGILDNYDEWDFHGDPSVHISGLDKKTQSDERHVNIGQMIEDAIGHIYDDTPMVDGDAPVTGPVGGLRLPKVLKKHNLTMFLE